MIVWPLCFLWRGDDYRHRDLYRYGPDYVNRLDLMIERHLTLPHTPLTCVTDEPSYLSTTVRAVAMPREVRAAGTYFPKLWAFSRDLPIPAGDRILMLDLDMVIVDNIDRFAADTAALRAWAAHPSDIARYNTSVVSMEAGAFSRVWDTFDPVETPARLASGGYAIGDQDWVSLVLGDEGEVWARTGEGIESYASLHGQPPPPGCAIVPFNGRRSPALPELQRATPWIVEHWR